MRSPAKSVPMEVRFWSRLTVGDGCWEWTGRLAKCGYGVIGARRSTPLKYAHRLSWEIHNGAIPKGLLVCHHYDNRRCVRPDHLFLGTHRDNARDASEKGRLKHPGLPRNVASHCPHGHPFDAENTYFDKRGFQRCRACFRANANRYYAEKKRRSA